MPASKPAGVTKSSWYFLAGLLHAALMLLAFPPVGVWPCAVIAPVPLIWAGQAWGKRLRIIAPVGANHVGRVRRAIRWIWPRISAPVLVSLGCIPLHAYAHQWVFDVSEFGYPPMVFLMSLFSGIFVWMVARACWRWPRMGLVVVAPVMWTALEVFRGEIAMTGYPWILVAHPMIDAPHFPGVASLLGTYFAGFLLVVFAGALFEAVWNRRIGWAVAGVGVFVAVVAVWGGPSKAVTLTPLRVGVVQTNVPQSNKSVWEMARRLADFNRFCNLTRLAAAERPDVIVWPETMFPGITLSAQGVAEVKDAGLNFTLDSGERVPDTVFFDTLMALSTELKIPMLVGALGFDSLKIGTDPKNQNVTFDYKSRFNSVFLVSGGAVDPSTYSKLELTPFGEIMPYINHWPWLQNVMLGIGANGMQFDLAAGAGPRVFPVRDVSVVTPICFEATKPDLCRRLVRAAGDKPVVIVNATNDGWFGSFRDGRLQHMQIARWRCVELGVPMVRAANTGISAAIDANGMLIKSGVEGVPGAWNQDGILVTTVTPSNSSTVYLRIGDVFGWVVLTVGSLAVIATFVGCRSNLGP